VGGADESARKPPLKRNEAPTLEAVLRVPPNGSRLSCGRPARRRKTVRPTVRAPSGAQRSASFEAITARILQALVIRCAYGGLWGSLSGAWLGEQLDQG